MGQKTHLLEPGGHQFATPALDGNPSSMYKVIFIVMDMMLLYMVGGHDISSLLYRSELSFIVETNPPN